MSFQINVIDKEDDSYPLVQFFGETDNADEYYGLQNVPIGEDLKDIEVYNYTLRELSTIIFSKLPTIF